MLCFVEVKLRGTGSIALPREFVDGKKKERLRRAALAYLSQHELDAPARFDVAEVYQQQDQALQNRAATGVTGEHQQLINDHCHDQYIGNIGNARTVQNVPQIQLNCFPQRRQACHLPHISQLETGRKSPARNLPLYYTTFYV